MHMNSLSQEVMGLENHYLVLLGQTIEQKIWHWVINCVMLDAYPIIV